MPLESNRRAGNEKIAGGRRGRVIWPQKIVSLTGIYNKLSYNVSENIFLLETVCLMKRLMSSHLEHLVDSVFTVVYSEAALVSETGY